MMEDGRERKAQVRTLLIVNMVVAIAAFFAIACGNANDQQRVDVKTRASTASQSIPAPQSVRSREIESNNPLDDCRATDYLILSAIIDNSLSMRTAPVPRPVINDLTPLTDHLLRCGGALALGALTNRATIFATCEVEEPPVPPAPLADGGDLITRAVRAAEMEDARRRYKIALAAWRAQAAAKVSEFRAKAPAILAPNQLSLRTDVTAGLRWADTFFAQPRNVPVEHRRLVVIAWTDAVHDADDKPVPVMESKPEFVLISTTGSGDLPFPTIPVTNMETAVRFALTPRGRTE